MIDLYFSTTIPSYFYNLIGSLKFQLTGYNCVLLFFNCPPSSKDNIESKFEDSQTVLIKKNYYEALETIKRNRPSIKFNLMKSLILSIQKTFIIQTYTPFFRAKTSFRNKDQDKFLGDIQGLVQIEIRDVHLFIIVSFERQLFLKVVSNMLMEEQIEINEENADATAEILNISLGIAINLLKQNDIELKSKIPFFFNGKDLSCISTRDSEESIDFTRYTKMTIPFKGKMGGFYVEIFFPQHLSNKEISELIL